MTNTEETPAKTSRFGRTAKFSLAGGVGAAALGIGAIVALPMLTGSAAYAVEAKDDGNVYVEIIDPEDAAGLEAELAKHGIQADVTYTPDGKMCDDGRYKPAKIEGSEAISFGKGEEGDNTIGFEVNPDNYKPGGDTTLVVDISKSAFSLKGSEDANEQLQVMMINIGAAEGEIGECVPVEAPVDEVQLEDEDGGEGTTEKKDDDGSKGKD